ncbi:alpha/beta hydrolase [Streptomyces sp. cg35]|uniref:alpha/beta hydrolase n=1 Tax=Streptomyces sp. cg35 TaxID=3421650 RepID=UPI003D1815C8
MSVFVLVPGFFNGAEVWAGVTRRLAATGAEVHAVDLTDADGTGHGGPGDGVVLGTHIERVVAAIDGAGAGTGRDIVLVGHDYGVYPALGAADCRAERIDRIVYVDAAVPGDGMPALSAVPDQSLRAQLASGSAQGDTLPVPAPDDWQLWGSTRGVPAAELERLTALSSPQPLGTLVQPLKLTGEAAAIPTTGVLCHFNGASIESVRTLVRLGNPALQALVHPDVTFFELPTGHWPMLSCPDDFAETLVKAAAGEGERLGTPQDGETRPAEEPRSFLLDVPALARERHGDLDLYLPREPADEPLPAVLFVHGGPVPRGMQPTPRDWPVLTGYGRYAASRGVVGATLDHRLHDVTDYAVAATDLAEGVAALRADPRVDAERIALWFLSGSGPLTAEWLDGPPAWLRCLVACYPIMAPLPNWGVPVGRFRPALAVPAAAALPLVVLRPELEQPVIAATVDEFLQAAAAHDKKVEVIDVPRARHGFEDLDHTEEARDAVHRAMTHVLHCLLTGATD